MPDPACSTSMGEGQTATTDDQPPVVVSRAHRPYFMAEYAAGSGEYLRAFVVDENQAQVKLRFPGKCINNCLLPGKCIACCLASIASVWRLMSNSNSEAFVCAACKETKNKDELVWVSRCSSTIWRRSIAKDAWAKVANGEGAWRPKKRKGTAGRPSRKKSAKLEDGGFSFGLRFSFLCALNLLRLPPACILASGCWVHQYLPMFSCPFIQLSQTIDDHATLMAVQCHMPHAMNSVLCTTSALPLWAVCLTPTS